MADIVKCDYIHSFDYRNFVNLLAKEGMSLSQGTWWVEKVNGSVGVAYHLFVNNDYLGNVRKEDLGKGDVNQALWCLMRYLEGFMTRKDWSIMVFPRSFAGTSWYSKSMEFICMFGVKAKRDWTKFLKEL